MTKLEVIVEELDNGFHFRDTVIDIAVIDKSGYQMETTFLKKRQPIIEKLSHVTKKKDAYFEFHAAINTYWSSPFAIKDAAVYNKLNTFLTRRNRKYHLLDLLSQEGVAYKPKFFYTY